MQDLEADGVIKRNVPYSTSRRGKDGGHPGMSVNPSQSLLPALSLKNSPSLSSIQTANTVLAGNPFSSRHKSMAVPH